MPTLTHGETSERILFVWHRPIPAVMKDIYTYLSPFLAALIASVITYLFTTRAKKQEVLILQRLQAFKAVQKQLALFKAYYFAKLSEIYRGELV